MQLLHKNESAKENKAPSAQPLRSAEIILSRKLVFIRLEDAESCGQWQREFYCVSA